MKEKQFNPELWKKIGVKPVEETQTPASQGIQEVHSFLGTAYVDTATNTTITSFEDNYIGGVRRPYRTPEEHEAFNQPYDNIVEERRLAGGRIAGIEPLEEDMEDPTL